MPVLNSVRQEMDERSHAWRTGAFKVLARCAVQEKTVDAVQSMFYGSRLLSETAFGVFWAMCFEWLARQGEGAVVERLQKWYLEWDSAKACWTAEWRGALDRVACGFFVGLQPQEAWHKHRLRACLQDLRLPASTVVERLGGLFEKQAQQGDLCGRPLLDVPSGAWSRRCADEGAFLLEHKALCLRSGTAWCMRVGVKSLEKLKTPASADLVPVLRTIYLSKNRAACKSAMLQLPGLAGESTPMDVAKVLEKFCLVLEDAEALPYWRSATTAESKLLAWHGRGCCWGCPEFAVRGTCGHLYASLIDRGENSVEAGCRLKARLRSETFS